MSNVRTVTARLADEVAAGRLLSDGGQYAAAAQLDRLCRSLDSLPTGILQRLHLRSKPVPRGVYLWGGVGRGKTLLMDFFVGCMAQTPRGKRRVERIHFYHFMRDLHVALRAIKQHERPLEIVAQQLSERVQILCLDEFFVSDIADAMILSGLLDGLFRRGVVLVATSNVAPAGLYRDGLQRQRFLPAIASMQANLDVLHLDGAVDYRLRQLEKAPTYLDHRATATQRLLQSRYVELAGGATSGPVTLRIQDRDLRAIDSGPGLVWFEFAELCDGPRSQNDYIEIAHLFHTVFVTDIPLFDAANDNAARRFIMLIDELYDRGVKLVVSAAAPPIALYHGERLAFEFARATSRLIEMQTLEYLAGQHRP